MEHTIAVVDATNPGIRAAILERLVAYNTAQVGDAVYRPLAVAITDSAGETIGGLWGWTEYGWLFVELLF